MKKQLFLLCLLSVFGIVTWAQNKSEKRITIVLNDGTFEQFVKEAESQTGCFFYYEKSLLDNLKITLQAKDQTLTSALLQVFKGTDFTFSIDTQQRVFVTSDQAIITALPSNLFEGDNSTADQPQYVAPTTDESDKLLSTAESKTYDIGPQRQRIIEGKSTVSGYVRNAVTGEPVIGAAVYIESPSIGVTTDALGFFALKIPNGKHTSKSRVLECVIPIAELYFMEMENWTSKPRRV